MKVIAEGLRDLYADRTRLVLVCEGPCPIRVVSLTVPQDTWTWTTHPALRCPACSELLILHAVTTVKIGHSAAGATR